MTNRTIYNSIKNCNKLIIRITFLIITFIMLNSFTKTPVLDTKEKLEKVLLQSQTEKQIQTVLELFDKSKYGSVFKYVPDINPLDPKRLKRISSDFGTRYHPISKKYKKHNGIDMASPKGTPIHATANGKIVLVSKKNTGYGYEVKIQHKYGFVTHYAHMSQILTKGGNYVKKGQIIGLVGSTGHSTGNHLHYEIIKNGKFINPKPFVL